MLQSPLTGTAVVAVALGALAVPLRHLTRQPESVAVSIPSAPQETADASTPAVLRLKLLAPADSIRLIAAGGITLLNLDHPQAGESEYDVMLPIKNNRCDMTIEANFGPLLQDTALFLTVMPDALDAETRYLVGTGPLSESWSFTWNTEALTDPDKP